MNFYLKFGFFSYAECPKPNYYSRNLGVTGSFDSFHPQIIATLKEYNIKTMIYAPSVFGKSNIV
jgi:hypothetical protein